MTSATIQIARRSIGRSADRFAGLLRRLAAIHAIARERHLLRQLDDRSLRDIGLTRGDVVEELRRPLWVLPHTRRW